MTVSVGSLTMWDRHVRAWQSFRRLPGWVQIWVGCILVPVNAASFLFLDYPVGFWTAMAAVAVVLSNYPIMLMAAGMSRLMSVPHVLIWGPLQPALLYWLVNAELPVAVTSYVVVLLFINGISLIFDVLDSWRWLRGERDIP